MEPSLPLHILFVVLSRRVERFRAPAPRQSPARDAKRRLIPLAGKPALELTFGIGHRQPDGVVGRGGFSMTDKIGASWFESNAQVNAEDSPRWVAPHSERRGRFREMDQTTPEALQVMVDPSRLQRPNSLIAQVILDIHRLAAFLTTPAR